MKKIIFAVLCTLFTFNSYAQQSNNDFIGKYLVKDNGKDYALFNVIKKSEKIYIVDSKDESNILDETKIASKDDLKSFANRYDFAVQLDLVSGLKDSKDKIIMLKIPAGSTINEKTFKTGYLLLMGGIVEVEKIAHDDPRVFEQLK